MDMEQAYSHNDVKSEFTMVLRTLSRKRGLGRYFSDGMVLSHLGVGLTTVPDGMFVLQTTFQSNRVQEEAGRHPGVIEFVGTPDMVLEILSDHSQQKDFVELPDLYHRAEIPEFWRVDARTELQFEILRWTATGYVSTPLPDGWWHSDLFGCDFQLTQQTDVRGQPEFVLHVRP
jgi:Uma2 family endonuclease